MVAKSSGAHHIKHTIGNNFILFDTIFLCYQPIFIGKYFSPSIIPVSGNSNFKVDIIDDQAAASDRQSINYWSFIYPRVPSFLIVVMSLLM